MARRPNVPLALALGVLAAVALALNASQWTSTHRVVLPFAGLAATLLVMLAVLPWTIAPRPAAGPDPLCHKCGAPVPPPAIPSTFCLMCGAFPRAARTVG